MSNIFNVNSKLVINSKEDPMTLPRLATDPISGMVAGDFYYNTTEQTVKYFNGTAWSAVASGVVSLEGQALDENHIIVGDNTDTSVTLDTGTLGEVLVNTSGLTIKNDVITNTKISSTADIDRTKLDSGSANRLVYNNATGVMADLPIIMNDMAVVTDADGLPVASTVTSTELNYLSGVTSLVQNQLNDSATDIANLVSLSGVPANSINLGSFSEGIIPPSQTTKQAIQALESSIASLPDPMEYKGLWDASTNTPSLTDGTGNNGDVYQVSVAGTQFTPSISFAIGDKVVYNGATAKYEKWAMTDSVLSVNNQTGIVVLDSDDIAEGSTNLYFTDEKAQDAVGTILINGSKISLTYNDATPSITADVIADSLVNADISAIAAIDATKLADGSVSNTEFQYLDGVTSSIQTQLNGRANTLLSNLTGPTSVNQNLRPDSQGVRTLGGVGAAWSTAHSYVYRPAANTLLSNITVTIGTNSVTLSDVTGIQVNSGSIFHPTAFPSGATIITLAGNIATVNTNAAATVTASPGFVTFGVFVRTENETTSPSGEAVFRSGNITTGISSGFTTIKSGDSTTGRTGNVRILSGNSSSGGTTGDVFIFSGTTSGTRGSVNVEAGQVNLRTLGGVRFQNSVGNGAVSVLSATYSLAASVLSPTIVDATLSMNVSIAKSMQIEYEIVNPSTAETRSGTIMIAAGNVAAGNIGYNDVNTYSDASMGNVTFSAVLNTVTGEYNLYYVNPDATTFSIKVFRKIINV